MSNCKFGKVNKFGISEHTSYFRAVRLAYSKQVTQDSGVFTKISAGMKSPVYGTVNYTIHHPYKVSLACLVTLVSIGLAIYFLMSSSSYNFINSNIIKPVYNEVTAWKDGFYEFIVTYPILSTILAMLVLGTISAVTYMSCKIHQEANAPTTGRYMERRRQRECTLEILERISSLLEDRENFINNNW